MVKFTNHKYKQISKKKVSNFVIKTLKTKKEVFLIKLKISKSRVGDEFVDVFFRICR